LPEKLQGFPVLFGGPYKTHSGILSSQEDVLPHGKVWDQVELLVNNRYAGLLCGGWRGDVNRPALYKDSSGVRQMRAAQYFDKGALAGTILANEAQDLAAAQLHGDVFQCVHAGKRFIDPAHLQED
ncbi:unnamed protein product, partial [marine sediment metagenome]